jgi:NAD(P)-dependent dehydrogenase (short-subunit alcohol dehydrogenase family)
MPPSEGPMSGQVCVVTGANSGIGKAAALTLARFGAEVILVCRDSARGAAARAEIAAAAAAGQPRLEIADLSSMTEVRDLAGRLSALGRLDVLINNAGLVLGERRTSADGFEYTFAVNHLAPFLLTNLLREQLAGSAPARVITVSSAAHRGARLNLDDLQLAGHFNGWRAYSNSKLANILFTTELARRLTGTGVTANCLHPGTVNTGFGRDGSRLLRFGLDLGRRFLRTAGQGADTVVYLASSPDVAGATGGYYVNRKLRTPSRAARDQATARRLWEISAELTGLPEASRPGPGPAG